ncbi:glycoside hydrolase family 131 protein [Aplosporella prunicola CBS 121167]|uniref:Glycoside hydrolase family 131 protein n=1 Tax=Aplosporella prunicola CBS 121167 TaxID=1176127 RepID=A0A6A6B298_9PEZI|nr:glycoside hydrolase family 131 protein [Aplosporella prunicola CBS 121167]KAF2137344.1 glycoside hydrolase family 131 protein [Aplosporella prunicola CBS 121167]
MLYRYILAGFLGTAAAETLWDGRFDADTASALKSWSWSNQAGAYQYYIHGSGDVTDYVNVAADFKNPADSASKQGAKISIDKTSQWNGGGMLRTELIPQTDKGINKGTQYYHFSMMHKGENAPNKAHEHQVCFFESHFTEMKFGGSSGNKLEWFANSQSQWSVDFAAGVWHNIAYEIDFDGGKVSYYHSTGAEELKKVAGPVSVSASSNGADWHLGVLRLDGNDDATLEDWFFSGVYIEDTLTTAVGSGAASGAASKAVDTAAADTEEASSSAAVATTAAPVTSTAAAAATPTTLATVAKSSAAAVATPTASAAAASDSSDNDAETRKNLQKLYDIAVEWLKSMN